MFLHSGFWHFAGNMFFLWMFAYRLENTFGKLLFAVMYIVCGCGATALDYAFNRSSSVPCVGASGAISGIVGCSDDSGSRGKDGRMERAGNGTRQEHGENQKEETPTANASLCLLQKNASSGRTRTYNPPALARTSVRVLGENRTPKKEA